MIKSYTIDFCEFENNNYTKLDNTEIEIEYQEESYVHTFYVCCDEDIECDTYSFNLSYYGDDVFFINQNRCELEVHIKPNLTPYDKYFYITCTHAQDANVYETLTLIQKAEEFTINLGEDFEYVNKNDIEDIKTKNEYDELSDEEKNEYDRRVTLKLNKEIFNLPINELSKSNYNYYEEKTVPIQVTGGSGKYEINSILRYDVEMETEEITISPSMFDNGFIYTLEDNEIKIKSYGMPFLNIDNFYEIIFCHKDTKDVRVRLKIEYQNNSSPRTNININNIILEENTPQISDIYLPLETLKEMRQENKEEVQIIEYEIVFEDEIENDLIIYNNPETIVLPFEVFANGETSNLMVGTYSSAKWCDVRTDETNRNLLITIKEKPLCRRRCYIKVFIVDYQNIINSFYVVNIIA